MSLDNIQPKPKEATAPEPAKAEPVVTESEAPFSVSAEDLGTDSFDSFFDDERETPNVEAPEKKAPKEKKGFFGKLFSSNKDEEQDSDEPNLEDVEMSDELYDFTAEAATEITDTIFSNANDKLHATDDPTKWQASEQERTRLQKAWKFYVKTKKMAMSPFAYLMFTIFMIYGLGTLFGIMAYLGRIQRFGWHWPWSDSWKEKQDGMAWKAAEPVSAQSSATNLADSTHLRTETAEKAQNSAPQTAQPSAPTSTESGIPAGMKKCRQTGEYFKIGTGYPKAGKIVEKHPELRDSFCSVSAWSTYANRAGLMGELAHRKKQQEQQNEE